MVSLIGESGNPGRTEIVYILPPKSSMEQISDRDRIICIKRNILYAKYSVSYDPYSAYESLERSGLDNLKVTEYLEKEKAIAEAEEQARLAALALEREKKKAQEEEARLERLKKEASDRAKETSSKKTAGNGTKSAKKSSDKSAKKSSGKKKKKQKKGIFSSLFG